MAKRKPKTKRSTHRDENQSAFDIVQRIIERDEKAGSKPDRKAR